MRYLIFMFFSLTAFALQGQMHTDPWVLSQLSRVCWQQTYEGVLADYHPVTIILASDSIQVAGYIRHKGDQRVHRLLGDWNRKQNFQLQERDEYDRLTGYLRGSVKGDLLKMEWISADQNRIFDIVAYPKTLIKVNNFKPVAEWIKVDILPEMHISVQKMDYGMVSGIANRNGVFTRFEGYCLDGTCSIWNTVIQNPGGVPIKVQMQQKNATVYKAVLDGREYSASIVTQIPLTIRKYDNSMGFLDFAYPAFESATLNAFLGKWIDKQWNDGIQHLTAMNQPGSAGRLVHRSSGWMEIIDAGENHVSGMITYINPGSTRREGFIWLRKEDEFLTASDLFNTAQDLQKASSIALTKRAGSGDEDLDNWLQSAGFTYAVPVKGGLVMLTEFNMIYGDEFAQIPVAESRDLIRKKYWRYFGW